MQKHKLQFRKCRMYLTFNATKVNTLSISDFLFAHKKITWSLPVSGHGRQQVKWLFHDGILSLSIILFCCKTSPVDYFTYVYVLMRSYYPVLRATDQTLKHRDLGSWASSVLIHQFLLFWQYHGTRYTLADVCRCDPSGTLPNLKPKGRSTVHLQLYFLVRYTCHMWHFVNMNM